MIIVDGAEDGVDDAEHGVAGPLLHGSTQSDPLIFLVMCSYWPTGAQAMTITPSPISVFLWRYSQTG